MPRPRGNRKTARLSVSLDEREYAALCTLARDRDVSVAWLVRRAVHDLVTTERQRADNPELPLMRPGGSGEPGERGFGLEAREAAIRQRVFSVANRFTNSSQLGSDPRGRRAPIAGR